VKRQNFGLGGIRLRYHDLKIRDAFRLGWIATGCSIVFLLGLVFRSVVEPIVNRLPTRGGDAYIALMIALPILAIACAYIAVRYLLTSPAENAEYIDRMVSRGRELPKNFDASLLDPADPDYEVTTLDYLQRKRASRREA
jgi:hypothetical protein